MALYKTEAILLRSRDWGEADRMVTLFSREYGKLNALAKGARRPRSRFAGATQLFTRCQWQLFSGQSFDTVSQCEIIDSFRDVREDIWKLAYGTFMAELTDCLVPEKEGAQDVFFLLLNGLKLLQERNPRLTALIFAFQLLKLTGYCPMLQVCVQCQSPVAPEETVAFSPQEGGVVCGACARNSAMALHSVSLQTINQLTQFLGLNLRQPPAFSLPARVVTEMEELLNRYLAYHLEKRLHAIEFLAALKVTGAGGDNK